MTYPVDQPQPGSGVPERGGGHRASALEAEDGRSIGELLSDVSANLSTLMRQEVELAKAEVRQSGSRAGKGAGMFAGAAVGALLFLVFLSVSAWWGLGRFIGNEWSGLVVALIWAAVAGVLAMVGKKEFARIRGLQRTTETISKIPNAVRGHEEENR